MTFCKLSCGNNIYHQEGQDLNKISAEHDIIKSWDLINLQDLNVLWRKINTKNSAVRHLKIESRNNHELVLMILPYIQLKCHFIN